MYHCVPRIISGDSQISGSWLQLMMPETASGNIRLAGNAAMKMTMG